MFLIIRKRVLRRIAVITAVAAVLAAGFGWQYSRQTAAEAEPDEPDFIRWVDFQASYEALEAALELDIASQETDTPVSWIDLIALAAAKNGNNFSSFKRRELEGEDTKDYRALLKEMLFVRPGDFFNTEHKRKIAKQYRKMFIQMDGMARPRDYKKMYGGLTAGDPKLRTLRAIYQDISCAYADYAKRFRKGGEANG